MNRSASPRSSFQYPAALGALCGGVVFLAVVLAGSIRDAKREGQAAIDFAFNQGANDGRTLRFSAETFEASYRDYGSQQSKTFQSRTGQLVDGGRWDPSFTAERLADPKTMIPAYERGVKFGVASEHASKRTAAATEWAKTGASGPDSEALASFEISYLRALLANPSCYSENYCPLYALRFDSLRVSSTAAGHDLAERFRSAYTIGAAGSDRTLPNDIRMKSSP